MIWTDREKCKAMDLVEGLRDEEGASILIPCDNPDFNGHSDCFIEMIADWTDWEARRFEGKTLLDCLEKAADYKMGLLDE